MNSERQRPLQAFAAVLGGVALLAVLDAVMKHLFLVIGLVAVSLWRAAGNLTLSAPLYLAMRRRWPPRSVLRVHLLRSLLVMLMAILFLWGLGQVSLAVALALMFIAPLASLFLAAYFLKEKLRRASIYGSAVAFGGVVLIVIGQALSKSTDNGLLGIAAVIAASLCYAVNIVLMRYQALSAEPLEINFFQSATILALWLLVISIAGAPALPQGQWMWIAIASSLSTLSTLVFAWGYARGPASDLAVAEYSGFLWAAALGWLVFREPLTFCTLSGASLIIGGCLVATRRKSEPGQAAASA